jgi:tRNA (guanine37-N1)-methyltransferase
MRIDIISIFPSMFDGYFSESILGRAVKKRLLDIRAHDLRAYATDKHRHVDDKPFGGGPGMVMMVGPIHRALKALKIRSPKKARVILLAAKGKQFTHKDAVRLSAYDRLVFICGRYEGVDERVARHLADEEISIGPYVLTGGELPAMVIADAVARHIPGVLGKSESLEQESHAEEGVTEYPQYTRPAEYVAKKGEMWRIPKELLSGDHAKIANWREKKRKKTSKKQR